MAGRSISRFALAALAASALLGACVKHVDEQASAAPPPPAPPAQPVLMGAAATPAPSTDSTAADAAATQAQANDDAYIASLPAGLMAVHKFDPATGRTILVVSNYPVANPGLRARMWRARHHPTLNGGRDKGTPSITTASATPATTAQPSTTPAPTTMAQAAPTAPSATHSAPATQAAGFKGITLSPGMWLIGGIALLAIIVLVMLAGRKQQRREPLRA